MGGTSNDRRGPAAGKSARFERAASKCNQCRVVAALAGALVDVAGGVVAGVVAGPDGWAVTRDG